MSHPRIAAMFAPLLLACAADAQFAPNDLLADDWQKRNKAARALAAAEPDVAALIHVLRTEWNGPLPTFARFGGGAGRRIPREPRRFELYSARKALVKRETSPLVWYHGVDALDQLVVPCHPHTLARLVLQLHPDARADEAPAPSTVEHARVWLQLLQPDDERIAKACLETATTEAIVCALWLQGDRGRAQLRRLLPNADDKLRRAVLSLGKRELFDTPELVDVVVRQLTRARRSADYQQAGYLLLQLGEAAAAPLARACGDERTPRARAAGLLALLGRNAAPAAATLVRIADSDRTTRRRALIALSNIDIPTELRAKAAKVAWQVYEKRDQTSKLLALDALGSCKEGVDNAMRTQLDAALLDPPFGGTKARVLACLADIGFAPTATPAQMAYVATTIHPRTSTYIAVARTGADAADALRRLMLDPAEGIDKTAVANETDPNVLRLWLRAPERELRALALQGLTHRDSTSVGKDDLLRLMVGDPGVAGECITLLYNHGHRTSIAPQIVAYLDERSQQASSISQPFRTFLRDLQLPLAQKLTLYEPLLRRGLALSAIEGVDDDMLRKEVHRWMDAAEDIEVRKRLLSGLCRIGLRRKRDIALALDTLGGRHSSAVLFHLDESPDLPDVLREAMIEIVSKPDDDDGMPSTDAWYAREILLKHRQR